MRRLTTTSLAGCGFCGGLWTSLAGRFRGGAGGSFLKGKSRSVPGKHLNDQQVRTYMDHCRTHLQQTAAAKAGISERSARRIDRDPILLSQRKRPRIYRTRVNPFEDVWEAEIVPLLRAMPSLQAITILRELQRR